MRPTATDRIDFDPVAHRYKLNGRPVPNVSSVLEPLQLFDGVPPEILEAAAEFGRHVHEAIHLFNIDDLVLDTLDERLAVYLNGYRKFLADSSFKVRLSEQRVASKRYQYCGTLDLFGELNGRTALADAKSTAVLPRTVGPQTAAYAQALLETTGDKTARRYCLHLKPNDYKLVELKNPQDFTVYVSTLNIQRWRAAG